MFEQVLEILESGELSEQEMQDVALAIRNALEPEDEWAGSSLTSIIVAEEEFELRFKSKAQIAALGRLKLWLNEDIAGALEDLGGPGALKEGDWLANLRAMAALCDPRFFVGLGHVLTSKDRDWVEENFDLDWIIAGATVAYRSNKFISRVASAFFTGKG